MYCRKSKRIILYYILHRKETTLLQLILIHVEEDSTIFSDKYSAYVNIKSNKSKLEEFNYDHFWTNHSKNFVDEYQFHIHTNSIERQWRKFCNQVSSIRRSFSPEIIQQY